MDQEIGLAIGAGVGSAAATAAAYEAWRRATQRDIVDGKPVTLRRFDPRDIKTDADTFQFKSGGDQSGVTDRLRGVKRWNPVAAGKAVVWERADGQNFIADGHQRRGLGERLANEGQTVRLDAYVLRERDGWSARDVRAYAAIKNMHESSGTPLDMAKVMRERPDLVSDTLPMADAKLREARALANLSEPAFKMVVGGAVKPEHAAAVGDVVKDTSRHVAMLTEMAQAGIQSAQHARLYVGQAMAAPTFDETNLSLFGEETQTRSLLKERAQVLDRAIQALRTDKRIFGLLDREASNIEAAGNRLARDTNAARADGAARTAELVERLATSRGPLSTMLDEAARAVAEGAAPAKAARAFVSKVGGALKTGGLAALTGDAAPAVAPVDPNQGHMFGQPYSPKVIERDKATGRPLKREPLKPGATERLEKAIMDKAKTIKGPASTDPAGQTSFLPEPTTKEKLAAQANKPLRGGNAPADEGLFGSSMHQTDLVEAAKAASPKDYGGYKLIGTDRTMERGEVNVYLGPDGRSYVGDKNMVLDIDGKPLGLRGAPSGIDLAAAKHEPGHRLHGRYEDPGSPNFKPIGWSDAAREASANARGAGDHAKALTEIATKIRAGKPITESDLGTLRAANEHMLDTLTTSGANRRDPAFRALDDAAVAVNRIIKSGTAAKTNLDASWLEGAAENIQASMKKNSPQAAPDAAVQAAYEAHKAAITDTTSDPKTKADRIAETRIALQEAQHSRRAAERGIADGTRPASAAEPMTIVLASAEKTKLVPTGRLEKFDGVNLRPEHTTDWEGRAAVWVNNGTAADLEKAKAYAAKEGMQVMTFPTTEQDPLGKARAAIEAQKKAGGDNPGWSDAARAASAEARAADAAPSTAASPRTRLADAVANFLRTNDPAAKGEVMAAAKGMKRTEVESVVKAFTDVSLRPGRSVSDYLSNTLTQWQMAEAKTTSLDARGSSEGPAKGSESAAEARKVRVEQNIEAARRQLASPPAQQSTPSRQVAAAVTALRTAGTEQEFQAAVKAILGDRTLKNADLEAVSREYAGSNSGAKNRNAFETFWSGRRIEMSRQRGLGQTIDQMFGRSGQPAPTEAHIPYPQAAPQETPMAKQKSAPAGAEQKPLLPMSRAEIVKEYDRWFGGKPPKGMSTEEMWDLLQRDSRKNPVDAPTRPLKMSAAEEKKRRRAERTKRMDQQKVAQIRDSLGLPPDAPAAPPASAAPAAKPTRADLVAAYEQRFGYKPPGTMSAGAMQRWISSEFKDAPRAQVRQAPSKPATTGDVIKGAVSLAYDIATFGDPLAPPLSMPSSGSDAAPAPKAKSPKGLSSAELRALAKEVGANLQGLKTREDMARRISEQVAPRSMVQESRYGDIKPDVQHRVSQRIALRDALLGDGEQARSMLSQMASPEGRQAMGLPPMRTPQGVISADNPFPSSMTISSRQTGNAASTTSGKPKIGDPAIQALLKEGLITKADVRWAQNMADINTLADQARKNRNADFTPKQTPTVADLDRQIKGARVQLGLKRLNAEDASAEKAALDRLIAERDALARARTSADAQPPQPRPAKVPTIADLKAIAKANGIALNGATSRDTIADRIAEHFAPRGIMDGIHRYSTNPNDGPQPGERLRNTLRTQLHDALLTDPSAAQQRITMMKSDETRASMGLPGWSDEARAASLKVRQANAQDGSAAEQKRIQQTEDQRIRNRMTQFSDIQRSDNPLTDAERTKLADKRPQYGFMRPADNRQAEIEKAQRTAAEARAAAQVDPTNQHAATIADGMEARAQRLAQGGSLAVTGSDTTQPTDYQKKLSPGPRQPGYAGDPHAPGQMTGMSKNQLIKEARARGIKGDFGKMTPHQLASRLGYKLNYAVTGPVAIGLGIGAAALLASNQSAEAGQSGREQAVAAGAEVAKGAGMVAVIGGALWATAKLGAPLVAKAAGAALLPGFAAYGAYAYGKDAAAQGKGRGDVAKAAAWGAVNAIVPVDLISEAVSSTKTRLAAPAPAAPPVNLGAMPPTKAAMTSEQFSAANDAFQAMQQTSDPDGKGKRGWANPAVQRAAQEARGVQKYSDWAQK